MARCVALARQTEVIILFRIVQVRTDVAILYYINVISVGSVVNFCNLIARAVIWRVRFTLTVPIHTYGNLLLGEIV